MPLGKLAEVPLETLAALDRVSLLSQLKSLGVDKLGHRQALANGLSKAKRLGTLAGYEPPASPPAATPPVPSSTGGGSAAADQLSASRPPPMPLAYKLSLPARPTSAPQRPPLVVLLHGSGADENNLLPFGPVLSEACAGAVVASLRGPYGQLSGAAWFHGSSAVPAPDALASEIGRSADALVAFLEAAPATLGTDPTRACLLAFSQGATIGWTLALMRWPRPDLLCALALLSGRAMPELLEATSALGVGPWLMHACTHVRVRVH